MHAYKSWRACEGFNLNAEAFRNKGPASEI